MKISYIPRYGAWAASSRLRVYAVASAMNLHGLAQAVIGFDPTADVLVLQKAVAVDTFALASGFSGRVVYDVDDLIDGATLQCAARCADVLVADTVGRAEDLLRRLPRDARVRHVDVIPDALDYEAAGPRGASAGESAVWFGNYPNFESARWMVEALARYSVPVAAISDLSAERAALPGLGLTAWKFETFPGDLRRHSVAILSHRAADPHKSANKMAAAYHLGVPCIVSDSEEYRRLACALGLEWTYVQTESELLEAWDRLRNPATRAAAVAKAQPCIAAEYGAQAVARRAIEVYSRAA